LRGDYATLRNWTLRITLLDIGYGALASRIAATAAYFAVRHRTPTGYTRPCIHKRGISAWVRSGLMRCISTANFEQQFRRTSPVGRERFCSECRPT
jgi:hypothetical protein